MSRWESGAGIPDINIIQSVAEFYGVTVDEILSGERKTFDEETLSYKTQKEKQEGRNRLIRENALNKYNLYFIVALSVPALFGVLTVVFFILARYYGEPFTTLMFVFMIIAQIFPGAAAIYGERETKRELSSLKEELPAGVAEAEGIMRKKSLFVCDCPFIAAIIVFAV